MTSSGLLADSWRSWLLRTVGGRDVLFGQLYSTDSTDVAVNVTPFLKTMLLMIGVIGW